MVSAAAENSAKKERIKGCGGPYAPSPTPIVPRLRLGGCVAGTQGRSVGAGGAGARTMPPVGVGLGLATARSSPVPTNENVVSSGRWGRAEPAP